MVVEKIPLQVRLQRIKSGYAGDPAFVPHAIQTMANIPIKVYLGASPKAYEEIRDIFLISEDEGENMTYQELAWIIREAKFIPGGKARVERALDLLAQPLRRCYEERRECYGKGTTNTP